MGKKTNSKKKANGKKINHSLPIILAIVVVAVIISVLNIPSKEEKILNMVSNGEYAEAIDYLTTQEISSLKENETTEKIKSGLLSEYEILSRGVLSEEVSYETGKDAYDLGEMLFSAEVKKSDAGKNMKAAIDIAKVKADVKSMIDKKNYTTAFTKITSSPYIISETYRAEFEKILSEVDKAEALAEVEDNIRKSVEKEGFASAPGFMDDETGIISEIVSAEKVASLKGQIETSNMSKTCEGNGCKNLKKSKLQYCVDHICKNSDCDNYAENGYCYAHTCKASGCKEHTYSDGSYCMNHTCNSSSCKNYANDGYCYAHACKASGCDNGADEGKSYCYYHTCSTSGCYNYASDEYCSAHRCYKCKGTGTVTCTTCYGSGSCRYYASNNDWDYEYGPCFLCDQTGRWECSACDGRGGR